MGNSLDNAINEEEKEKRKEKEGITDNLLNKLENQILPKKDKFIYNELKCCQKQQNAIKNKTHYYIKSKELKGLKRILKLFRVEPHEELSVKGSFWNSLHYSGLYILIIFFFLFFFN